MFLLTTPQSKVRAYQPCRHLSRWQVAVAKIACSKKCTRISLSSSQLLAKVLNQSQEIACNVSLLPKLMLSSIPGIKEFFRSQHGLLSLLNWCQQFLALRNRAYLATSRMCIQKPITCQSMR